MPTFLLYVIRTTAALTVIAKTGSERKRPPMGIKGNTNNNEDVKNWILRDSTVDKVKKMDRPILSTHVLDTSKGRPAFRVFTELFKQKDDSWTSWHCTATSSDGRIQFPFTKDSMSEGVYKLRFNIGDYYKYLNIETLYPYIEIVFKVGTDQHYHIPLLITPFGYSTYRGN